MSQLQHGPHWTGIDDYLDGEQPMGQWPEFTPDQPSMDTNELSEEEHRQEIAEAYAGDYVPQSQNTYHVDPQYAEVVDDRKAELLTNYAQKKAQDYADRQYDQVIFSDTGNAHGATEYRQTPDGDDQYILHLHYGLAEDGGGYLQQHDFSVDDIYQTIRHEAGHLVGISEELRAKMQYNPNAFEEFLLNGVHEGVNSVYTAESNANHEPYGLYQQVVADLADGDPADVLNDHFSLAYVSIGGDTYSILSPYEEAIEASIRDLEQQYGVPRDTEPVYGDVTEQVRPEVIQDTYQQMVGAYDAHVASADQS